jgi:hypothetical protein
MVAQRAYQEANFDAYRTVFLSTIAVTALGLGSALLLPDADKADEQCGHCVVAFQDRDQGRADRS